MGMVATEMCYIWDQDAASATEDKKHAFDSPLQTMYAMGAMRWALPDDVIRLDEELNSDADMVVRHSRGVSEPFRRGRTVDPDTGEVEGNGQGGVQGGSDSPCKYTMCCDFLNKYWDDAVSGVVFQTSGWRHSWITRGSFADDISVIEQDPEGVTRFLTGSGECALGRWRLGPVRVLDK